MARWVGWLLIALWIATPAPAAEAPASLSSGRIHFKTIGVDDGLPHNSVRALLQDHAGFLWIGTQDGLARYDGRATEVFRRLRRDPDSIGDNHVTALAEDRAGRIWIAHQAAGLSRYDPRTQRFAHFPATDPAQGLPSPRIAQLLADPDGDVYVLSFTGALRRWDESAARFVTPDFARTEALPTVGAIAARRGGGLWLGTARGLWRWDGAAPSAASVGEQPAGVINTVLEDDSGAVWIGTSTDGLWRRASDGTAARVDVPSTDEGLREVLSLLLDRDHRLWAGTRAGVTILDAASARVLTIQTHRSGDPRGLAAERVVSFAQTRDGLVWVGTWAGGISVHDPRTEAFTLVREKDENTVDLANQTAPAVLANADNTIWVARGYGGGLTLMDIDGGMLAHYRHDPAKPESLGSNFVMTLAHGVDGDVWIGTGDYGIDRLRPDGTGFEHFEANDADPAKLPAGGIRGLYVEPDGTVWAGSMGAGIAVRCARCDRFRRYANRADDPASFPADGAYSFLRTQSGELWVGTRAHGILRLEDPETGRFTAIAGPVGAPGRLSHGSVTYLTEDPDGTVWAGTQGGGLNRLVRDAKGAVTRVDVYSTENGLSADAIGAVLRDHEGRLWITATRGVSRIDPKSGAIDAFEPRHGAQLSYYIGAGDALPDGRFVLGGFDGVTVFDPEAVVVAPDPVQPLLTDLRVFNDVVRPGPDAPLAEALAFAKRVQLDYKHNVVSFGFTAPVFRNAALLGLSYKLEGRDTDWIRADAGQRSASYSGLTAGDYRFRVRAWTVAGSDAAPEAAVDLRVLPPPWATSWAYAGYLLAAALLVLAVSWPMVLRLRERRAARAAIEASEQRLKLALWGSGDELWELDLDTRRVHRDNRLPGVADLSDAGDARLDDFSEQIHVGDQPGYEARLQAILTGLTDTFEHAFRIRGAEDEWRWIQARGRVVARDAAGKARKLAGTHQDVTPLKLIQERQQQLQETLRHQAFHDALTGLANRALFYEQLALSLAVPESGGVRLAAVVVADLDEFKLLNDSLGPSAGDRLLCEVGERLRRLVPEESGMVARLSGDEFAILMERTSPDAAFVLADRAMEVIRKPFDADGQRLHTTASIGVAFAASGESADDALRNADLAMYRAKSLGRNRIEVFSPDLHQEFSRRLATVAAVRGAIEDAAVLVHFQPIVELATGRWVGAEALARLAVDDPFLASPASFIPIAEEAGLIDALGEMILRRALDDARRIGLPGAFFVTVNVSPRQLQQPGLAGVVETALRDAHWAADRLVLELTESTLMTQTEVSRANLTRIRALGVRLALDDFGTGYSSLAQLGRERFDVLKIAKPFVDGLPGSTDSVHMAEAIVRMAESLRMSVIAEGVEHPAQAESLRRMGCSYAQGFEFGQPMPAPALADVSAARMR